MRQWVIDRTSALLSRGVANGDSDEVRAAKAIWMGCMSAAVPLCWSFLGISAWLGWRGYTLYFLAMSVFCTGALACYLRVPSAIETIGLATQSFMVVSSAAGVAAEGGLLQSGGMVFLGLIGPLYALAFPRVQRAVHLLAAYLASIVGLAILQPGLVAADVLAPAMNLWLFVANFSTMAVFSFAALLYFVRRRAAALEALRKEQDRSERLLLNILPEEVAAILKHEERVIADQFDSASVLFADVVGFTPMSAGMTPVEVVQLLNEVFSRFDALAETHGLEKIKTIGDCYMVASGIPRPRADHATALARFAVEVRDLTTAGSFAGGRRLQFRIGINSGPLVAGVIGRKKFIYDLWGDTVNTASRMESHGTGGAIQICRQTYDLIKDDFECSAMPAVVVKGKGPMEVWRVEREREHGASKGP